MTYYTYSSSSSSPSSPSTTNLPDYYDILKLTPKASALDIKKSYRKLALEHHPDRQSNPTDSQAEEAKAIFQQIGEAYEILSDPPRKQAYDRERSRINPNSYQSSTNYYYNKEHSNYKSAPRRPRVDPYAQFQQAFFVSQAFDDLDDEFSRLFGGPRAHTRNASGYVHQGQQDTSKSYTDSHGRRVFVQSLMRNGNAIQETYIDNVLTERRVNGQLVSFRSAAAATASAVDSFEARFAAQRQEFAKKTNGNNNNRNKKPKKTNPKMAQAQKEADAAPMTSRSYIDNKGQRVLIQSLVRNGMQLEDKFVGDKLVESKINGKVVAVY